MSNFVRHLLKENKINTYNFMRKDKNLFELLSIQPNSGVGVKVTTKEWLKKGRTNQFISITRSSIKNDLKHGKAWGELNFNGKLYKNSRIRTGLKLNWVLYKEPTAQ